MSKGPEYALATELVNKLRYFNGDCALCELCNHRHNCDSDGLFGCKTGIAEWIFKVLRNAEKKEPTEEQIRKKAYYQAHKAEYTARAKARYENNKEKHNEQNRQYYQTHKDEYKQRAMERKERLRAEILAGED